MNAIIMVILAQQDTGDATAASDALAEFLLMAAGEPVFTAERTTWLEGQAVTNTRLYFRRGYRMVARY